MLVGVGETPPQCLPRHPHLGDTMSEQDRQDLPPRALAEETAAHAILTTDLQGRIRTWNAGAEHLLGYDAAEMIGQSAGRLFPPEEMDAGPFGAQMRAARVAGHVGNEGWLVRKDGSRLWTAGHTLVLHDSAGAEVGFAKFIRDATASREGRLEPADAELRFRTLVEQVRDFAIFLLDPAGYNTSWNEGARRLLGYDPAEFSGFAFGMGPERITILKHGVEDIRNFWANDLRFLEQF